MTGQIEFDLNGPPPLAAMPDRRIDITIERLRINFEALSNEDRAALVSKPWWAAIL